MLIPFQNLEAMKHMYTSKRKAPVEWPADDTTVPPESICTSAAGFTRWTQGQCTRFALASTSRGTNEARDETETKPRETCVLQWPRLHALNCLCLLFVCVSLLVIRSHLPKRFSRKPQPHLAISLMHRSRLDLLSLEIMRRTLKLNFDLYNLLFYRSVNLLSKYPCRTRNFSNKLIENGEWSVVSVVRLRLISFAICMRNAFVCFPQIFFFFCITNETFFVCRASNSVCALFKRNNFLYVQQNYKRRLSVRPAAIEKVPCEWFAYFRFSCVGISE